MANLDEQKLMSFLRSNLAGGANILNADEGNSSSSMNGVTQPVQPLISGDTSDQSNNYGTSINQSGTGGIGEDPQARLLRIQLEKQLQDQINQQKGATQDQKDLLLSQAQNTPAQANLSGLAAFADQWAHNDAASKGYVAPPTAASQQDALMKGYQNYLGSQNKLTEDQTNYLKTMLNNNQSKQQIAMQRLALTNDRLGKGAMDAFDTNPQVKAFGDNISQADKDLGVLMGGGVINSNIVAELSQGMANLFAGRNGTGEHAAQNANFANNSWGTWNKIKEQVENKPFQALSPENQQLMIETLQRLKTYNAEARYDKIQQLAQGRNYSSPQIMQNIAEKKEAYNPNNSANAWTKGASNASASQTVHVINAAGKTGTIAASDLQDAIKEGYKQVN